MIENTVNKILYIADGIQREWPVSFDFKDIEDISLYILKKNPFEEMVKITEDFEWNEQKNAIIYPTIASGLPVVEKDTSVLVIRNTPTTQLEDSSKIPFTSGDVERALDKLTMEVQDNKEQINRSLRVPHNSILTPNELMKNLLEAEENAEASATAAVNAAAEAKLSQTAAESANQSAQQAKTDSEAAKTAAESAAQTATTAIQGVDQKVTDAVDAANRAEQASADTLANAQKAETAAQTATDKAEEAAQSAKDAAEAAQNLSHATESTYGIARIATSEEATIGTNNEAYMTPSKTKAVVDAHSSLKNNPHSVTKAQVGLGNVDNTSDANKPVSSATQEALDKKADLVNGSIPIEQIPISFVIKDWRN